MVPAVSCTQPQSSLPSLPAWNTLQECGIGWHTSEDSPGRSGSPDMGLDSIGAGHRVLVFAQLKGMLDLVETNVLRPGAVSFLRLDGRSDTHVLFSAVRSGTCSYCNYLIDHSTCLQRLTVMCSLADNVPAACNICLPSH